MFYETGGRHMAVRLCLYAIDLLYAKAALIY